MIRCRWTPVAVVAAWCFLVAGLALADVSCTGEGENPPVRVEQPDSLAFGLVAIGQSKDLAFTITNAGGGVLADSVRIDEACSLSWSIVSGAGPYSLSAGEGHEVVIRYAPTEVAGPEYCKILTTTE